MDTFKTVAKVSTYQELAGLFAAVQSEDWQRGKFFFCPDGIPPLMENAKNIRGGSYSLRVDRALVGEYMEKFMLAAVQARCVTTEGDLVSCVRITPRRDFNILQVWNRDCQKFCAPEGLSIVDDVIPAGEVKYAPHHEKKI